MWSSGGSAPGRGLWGILHEFTRHIAKLWAGAREGETTIEWGYIAEYAASYLLVLPKLMFIPKCFGFGVTILVSFFYPICGLFFVRYNPITIIVHKAKIELSHSVSLFRTFF